MRNTMYIVEKYKYKVHRWEIQWHNEKHYQNAKKLHF